MGRKKVAILGSTGSIGINTLKVIDRYPDLFKVVALSANNNIELLSAQIKKYSPEFVAVNVQGIDELKKRAGFKNFKFFNVKDVTSLVECSGAGILVLAMSGSAALPPFLSAVRLGMRVAPANKEALVMAGDIIMREAKKYGATIIPIDSEQSAIFQCLAGHDRNELKKVLLTASGGSLYRTNPKTWSRISVREVLRHPRWKMGKKITVDSATLMNKGFEVIEAKMLFGLEVDQIEVVIHPEAIIHSMVEFKDGSLLAQMGVTDMRLPIQYALTYPKRLSSDVRPMDFSQVSRLTFGKPDFKKFPALSLAFYCAKKGGTLPCVLAAADEEAVSAFLEGRIGFLQVYSVVKKVVLKHRNVLNPELKNIMAADTWAREEAQKIILN